MELSFPLSPLRMTVLISGGGTTLRNLLQRIDDGSLDAKVDAVISSSAQAAGLELARLAGIDATAVEREACPDTASFSDAVFQRCRDAGSHVVVMAGFLKLVRIPEDFLGRVLNIHPSLIPAFAGRGYYGSRVHRAVLDRGCKMTGCTVHFVDNEYDHGPIISQRGVPVAVDDTPESLAARVFAEECEAYPEALREFAAGKLRIAGRCVQ